MAKSIKGTKTEKNLLAAFAGESQARNRYSFFASAARKEGFEQIANIFTETAENEKEHAKIFFQYLEGGDAEITAAYPAGMIKDTKSNLEAAAVGENMEWTAIYADFSKTARDETQGFSNPRRPNWRAAIRVNSRSTPWWRMRKHGHPGTQFCIEPGYICSSRINRPMR